MAFVIADTKDEKINIPDKIMPRPAQSRACFNSFFHVFPLGKVHTVKNLSYSFCGVTSIDAGVN